MGINDQYIIDKCNEHIEYIFELLGADVSFINKYGSEIRIPCPVHGGDNATSFSYSIEYGTWICYSHHCHNGRSNLIDLASRVLNLKYDSARQWLCNKIGIELDDAYQKVEQDPDEIQINKLIRKHRRRNNQDKRLNIPISQLSVDHEKVYKYLSLSKNTAQKFYLGFCSNPNKPMYNRICFPILNEEADTVIGVTGRTLYSECDLCGCFHSSNIACPTERNTKPVPKWKHFGVSTKNVLYGYWRSKSEIKKLSSAIVFEGPKEVVKSADFGIDNTVAMLRKDISKNQIKKLVKAGALTIYLIMDNDEAGREALQKNRRILSDYFNVVDLGYLLSKKDLFDEDASTFYKLRDIIYG